MSRIVNIDLAGTTGNPAKFPQPSHPEVAFAGRSNVGKSSLLNALCGRKGLFKVSSSPGRTRTVVHAEAKLDNKASFYLVDLPGYGYARVSKEVQKAWADVVYEYLEGRKTLHLVVLLIDIRRSPKEEEFELLRFLGECGIPWMIAATRVDKLKKGVVAQSLARLKKDTGMEVIGTSARKKEGIDRLLSAIVRQMML